MQLQSWKALPAAELDPTAPFQGDLPRAYRWLRHVAICVVLLLAGAALIGWLADLTRLASHGSVWLPMSPSTGICFLLLGFGSLAIDHPRWTWLARVTPLLVGVLAASRLVGYVLGVDLGIDTWLVDTTGPTAGIAPIGRMALFSALGMILAAAALAVLTWSDRHRLAELTAGLLGAAVGLDGASFALGHAVRAPYLYGAGEIPMALPTALAFGAYGANIALRAAGATLRRQRRLEAALREANRVLEERVRERTAELEIRNRELQDFAYVASHDLQEPLRKVQAFGDRLADRFGPSLGAEGQDYLRRMRDAATRMRRLIDDLLSFSRVTTRGGTFRPTALRGCVEEALVDLEARIAESGGAVQVGELPQIEADPAQMRQLFLNLVGNALKYHRAGEAPRVRVWAEPDGDHRPRAAIKLFVRDEGIGFDERYLDRIFAPFQRLHGRGVYEGTGIGLAVCRRIVERHGGTITARSAPGAGATFAVTLPIRHPKADERGATTT